MIDLYPVPDIFKGRLAVALRPRGGDWLLDELRHLKRGGWTQLVTALLREELEEFQLEDLGDACAAAGLQWLHFPIADRGLPSIDATTSLTTKLVRQLVAGENIAVHCRQGIGRSSLVVAATLVAAGITADAAWASVERSRGRPVPDTTEQRDWLHAFERIPR